MGERSPKKAIRDTAAAHGLLPNARGHLRNVFFAAFALAAVHIQRGVVPVQAFSEDGRRLAANFVQYLGQFELERLFQRAAAAAAVQ